jgi:hypothetical protein
MVSKKYPGEFTLGEQDLLHRQITNLDEDVVYDLAEGLAYWTLKCQDSKGLEYLGQYIDTDFFLKPR